MEDSTMPFYLRDSDVLPQLAGLRSVLIVPCRFCPAASLAVREDKPYLELFRKGLRTEAYESYIRALEGRLKDAGIESVVFESRLPHQFVACMWTSARRKELARRAAEFDGVVVLGCDAAVDSVRDALGSTNCRVVAGMEVEGIMNIVPTVSFPGNVSLVVQSMATVNTSESGRCRERATIGSTCRRGGQTTQTQGHSRQSLGLGLTPALAREGRELPRLG